MRDFIALTHINNNNKVLCVCGVLLKRGTGNEGQGAGEQKFKVLSCTTFCHHVHL